MGKSLGDNMRQRHSSESETRLDLPYRGDTTTKACCTTKTQRQYIFLGIFIFFLFNVLFMVNIHQKVFGGTTDSMVNGNNRRYRLSAEDMAFFKEYRENHKKFDNALLRHTWRGNQRNRKKKELKTDTLDDDLRFEHHRYPDTEEGNLHRYPDTEEGNPVVDVAVDPDAKPDRYEQDGHVNKLLLQESMRTKEVENNRHLIEQERKLSAMVKSMMEKNRKTFPTPSEQRKSVTSVTTSQIRKSLKKYIRDKMKVLITPSKFNEDVITESPHNVKATNKFLRQSTKRPSPPVLATLKQMVPMRSKSTKSKEIHSEVIGSLVNTDRAILDKKSEVSYATNAPSTDSKPPLTTTNEMNQTISGIDKANSQSLSNELSTKIDVSNITEEPLTKKLIDEISTKFVLVDEETKKLQTKALTEKLIAQPTGGVASNKSNKIVINKSTAVASKGRVVIEKANAQVLLAKITSHTSEYVQEKSPSTYPVPSMVRLAETLSQDHTKHETEKPPIQETNDGLSTEITGTIRKDSREAHKNMVNDTIAPKVIAHFTNYVLQTTSNPDKTKAIITTQTEQDTTIAVLNQKSPTKAKTEIDKHFSTTDIGKLPGNWTNKKVVDQHLTNSTPSLSIVSDNDKDITTNDKDIMALLNSSTRKSSTPTIKRKDHTGTKKEQKVERDKIIVSSTEITFLKSKKLNTKNNLNSTDATKPDEGSKTKVPSNANLDAEKMKTGERKTVIRANKFDRAGV